MAYETLMKTLESESYAKEADIEKVRRELASLLGEMMVKTEEGMKKGRELVALLLGDTLKTGAGLIAGIALNNAVVTLAEKGYSEKEIEHALTHVWERIDASKISEKSLSGLSRKGMGDAERLLKIAEESSTAEEFRKRALEFGQKLFAENVREMVDALLNEILKESEKLILEKRLGERYNLSPEQVEKVLKVMDEYGLTFDDGLFTAEAGSFQYELRANFGDAPFDEDFRKFLEESIEQYYEIREELEKAGIKEPEVEIVGANGVLNDDNVSDFEEAAGYMATVQKLAEEGREEELRRKLEEEYSPSEVEDMMRWLGFESEPEF